MRTEKGSADAVETRTSRITYNRFVREEKFIGFSESVTIKTAVWIETLRVIGEIFANALFTSRTSLGASTLENP
jgi:hypothetical protein